MGAAAGGVARRRIVFPPMTRVPVRTALLAAAMSFWSMLGCRFSTTEAPNSLGNVRVLIDIEERTERQPEGRDPYEFKHVKAVLTDAKGLALELPDVKVLMNGEPLRFVVGTGNYYDRHPRYTLTDEKLSTMRPDTEYAFAVTWKDGATHNVGSVRTPKPLALSQISVPEMHRAGNALEIAWRDLAEPCDLIAYHGYEYPDEHGNMVQASGSVNADDVLRQTMGRGAGRMTVPASYFASDGKKRVASFGAEITCAAEARIAKPFHSDSRIRAVRTLTYRTELPAR